MSSVILALVWDNDLQRIAVSAQPADEITRLKTAITISLFTDARVNDEDVPDGELNRGYWGDMDLPANESMGSKLWLLKRSKLISDTLNAARDYITEALQWMVDDGLLQAVSVTVEKQQNRRLAYQLSCQLPSGKWEKIIMEHNAYGV